MYTEIENKVVREKCPKCGNETYIDGSTGMDMTAEGQQDQYIEHCKKCSYHRMIMAFYPWVLTDGSPFVSYTRWFSNDDWLNYI